MNLRSLFVKPSKLGAIEADPDDLVVAAVRYLDEMNDVIRGNGLNAQVTALGTAVAAHMQVAAYLREYDPRYADRT